MLCHFPVFFKPVIMSMKMMVQYVSELSIGASLLHIDLPPFWPVVMTRWSQSDAPFSFSHVKQFHKPGMDRLLVELKTNLPNLKK